MIVLFPFTGDTIGGSHIATLSLIKKLVNKGIDAKIVLHQKGLLAKYLQEEGFDFELIPHNPVGTGAFPSQILKILNTGWKISKWLKERDISVIHTNDLRMHYTWFLACWISGIKHVWHQHSHASSPRLWLYMAAPRHILTISNYAASSLPVIYKKKTIVVYNDFDVPSEISREISHESLRKELGLPKDTNIVGFVGNLTKQKRPDFFLDVAKIYIARAEYPPACFVMIGASRAETFSSIEKELSTSELQNRAFYIGARFPIEPYIAAFNALIAPASNEGLGRTLIEAMLLGTPVLASDHGGHREIIEDEKTGYLFNLEKPESCAERLAILLQNPVTATTIANNAKKDATHKFTGMGYLEKVIDIYRAI